MGVWAIYCEPILIESMMTNCIETFDNRFLGKQQIGRIYRFKPRTPWIARAIPSEGRRGGGGPQVTKIQRHDFLYCVRQITTQSLLKVLADGLEMIPNLPSSISGPLDAVVEQLRSK